ncbi:uncharacterized protein CTRU02_200968 [Colletotrichum truncatum]|uniref:Uncharacterized protein n=1 Tax=Colletotrichum truncatum TaxID=5467 RepID=A0ACC3ZG28_COLTU
MYKAAAITTEGSRNCTWMLGTHGVSTHHKQTGHPRISHGASQLLRHMLPVIIIKKKKKKTSPANPELWSPAPPVLRRQSCAVTPS